LPIPSLSTILAIPLILISAHLAVFGEASRIPRRARQQEISTEALLRIARFVVPVLRWIEHVSHPRLEALARRERLLGIVCLILSVVLVLPIPFWNLPPALSLVAIAFGMLQRDGLIVVLGMVGAVVSVASLYLAADFIGGVFEAIWR
jgi:hypothetical protein